MVPTAERVNVERSRRRLLTAVFLILSAFASAGVALTFIDPHYLTPLHVSPRAIRLGVLALTLGFILLVWDKERQLNKLEGSVRRQEKLVVAFESRLQVVEALLDSTDRINSPVLLGDVLNVVLETGMDMTGAVGGSIEYLRGHDEGLVVTARTSVAPPDEERGLIFRVPLTSDDELIGFLQLILPEKAGSLDEAMLEVLERFARQSGRAAHKAALFTDQRTSRMYLEAVNAVKQRFLGAVSHEMRTPLTSIVGYIATLDNHWARLDDERRREFVDSILRQSKSLTRVIERFLEAARLEFEGAHVQPVKHDVRGTLVQSLSHFAESDRLELSVPDRPVMGEVDPLVFEHVVSNLVDNSLRYTSGPVGVTLRVFRDQLVLAVADRGPGFAAERLDGTTHADFVTPKEEDARSGAGLGFQIVRTLVNAHLGRIEVDRTGSGNTVRVYLSRRFAPAVRPLAAAPEVEPASK